MTTPHNTAPAPPVPRPICPCRRSDASSVAQPAAYSIAAAQVSAAQVPAEPIRQRSAVRGMRGAAAFAFPSIALALVPKCPMCIAAWLALGGGLGISFTTATHLRTALVWLCWSVLALLTVRVAIRFRSRYNFKTRTMLRPL